MSCAVAQAQRRGLQGGESVTPRSAPELKGGSWRGGMGSSPASLRSRTRRSVGAPVAAGPSLQRQARAPTPRQRLHRLPPHTPEQRNPRPTMRICCLRCCCCCCCCCYCQFFGSKGMQLAAGPRCPPGLVALCLGYCRYCCRSCRFPKRQLAQQLKMQSRLSFRPR